jgi:hypothetical protein
MSGKIGEIYGRVVPFACAVPLAFALPVVAEFAQHAVEIRGGMYFGGMSPDGERLRLLFGGLKVLAIFALIIFAVRYWAFGGDIRRAARPTVSLLKGIAIFILVQGGGELLVMGLGRGIAMALGSDAELAARLTAMIVPLFGWLLFATLLYPWFVGLIVEDRSMTLSRSVRGIWGRLWTTFGLLLAAFLPAMILHYAFGYGAMDRPTAVVWAMMAVDALLVGVLAVLLASAYFTIYRRAVEAEPGEGGTGALGRV